jgi:hypothetical protein
MTIKIEDCREEVQEFACLMEKILRKNDHKGTWKDCDLSYLLNRLLEEVKELDNEVRPVLHIDPFVFPFPRENHLRIAREAADVANFAMMLWDVTK